VTAYNDVNGQSVIFCPSILLRLQGNQPGIPNPFGILAHTGSLQPTTGRH